MEVSCPVCNKQFPSDIIEKHVEKCLFLNNEDGPSPKRKKSTQSTQFHNTTVIKKKVEVKKETRRNIPLAEKMRPALLDDYMGQSHVLGEGKILRELISKKDIPSMILWGPPGCGKTSLANVICELCKNDDSLKFAKLSATMSGINEVKEVVKIAQNDLKYKKKTVLFMDEIHRFNKLQQDTFLPHIENGTIVLIGATTENPSFSLNNALLSRCRVIVLNKLTKEEVLIILVKALGKCNASVVNYNDKEYKSSKSRVLVDHGSLEWLSEICDGDARVALSSLQIAIQAKDPGDEFEISGPKLLTLEDIKDGIKRSHLLYDKKGEEHYNMISALHKSVRASDDDAALYWLTRMLEGGEDPIYIARRLVRMAGEDIGLADPKALTLAVSCLHGCQVIGMPECDVLLAECAVYLARADKSVEVYHALKKCKSVISEWKGPQPSVPLHLRNAPTKLMAKFGYGEGYNTRHKDDSGLSYLPEGMENVNFFE